MKRYPSILAGFAAILVAASILEYGARGLNPSVDSPWVLQPAWWQSDLIADWGLYVRAYSVDVFGPIIDSFSTGSFENRFRYLFWSQFIFAGIGYALVFYPVKGLLHFALHNKVPNQSTQPPRPTGG